MKKVARVLPLLGIALVSTMWLQSGGDPNYKPKRINKMIELLADGQPVYSTRVEGAGFEEGKKLAQTHSDLIQYQMEHGTFNPAALRQFMLGLVEGGPTKSGHRTPTVIVTLPVLGLDKASVRVNHWMIEQVLSAGVHGLMLCHARTPEAVKMFVATARYPFDRPGINDDVLPEGIRGDGSQGFASRIWGISGRQYMELADPWPLNPKGELILSLKLEDKYALANVEKIAVIPGIGWAEWGPGDQAMSLKGLSYLQGGGSSEVHSFWDQYVFNLLEFQGKTGAPSAGVLPPLPDAELEAARTRVFNALKANKIHFWDYSNMNNLEQVIKGGVMVTGGSSPELAAKGRAFTKRQMPY